jgi:hypothetical protein
MKKSYILQLLAVFLLIANILSLNFDKLSDYSVNKLQFINIMVAIFLLFFQLLDDGDKRKRVDAIVEDKSKRFGKRKEL